MLFVPWCSLRGVIEGIRQNKLAIAWFIRDDAPVFDPAHPDARERFAVPAGPGNLLQKPNGD